MKVLTSRTRRPRRFPANASMRLASRRVVVVGLSTLLGVVALAGSALPAAAQGDDLREVSLTNSYVSNDGPETIFDGPVRTAIGSNVEYVGFGGFDIDAEADGALRFSWSDDSAFDDFEGEFDDTFTDIFTFVFTDFDVTSARVDSAQGLAPILEVRDGSLRVVFGVGSAYEDGNFVDVAFTGTRTVNPIVIVEQPRDAETTVPATSGGAPTPAPPRQLFEAPDITLPATSQSPEETAPTALAATGRTSSLAASAGLALLASGGMAVVSGRRLRR